MIDNKVLAEIEESKKRKPPINKTILIVVGIVVISFIFFYIKNQNIGLIVVIIIAVAIILFSKAEGPEKIAITIKQARELIKEELNDLVGAQSRYQTVFPEGTMVDDIKWGLYDRQIDPLSNQILEFWIGFEIHKDDEEFFYVAKLDYWADGNGIVAINELEERFKSIPLVRIKLVPTSDYKEQREHQKKS